MLEAVYKMRWSREEEIEFEKRRIEKQEMRGDGRRTWSTDDEALLSRATQAYWLHAFELQE